MGYNGSCLCIISNRLLFFVLFTCVRRNRTCRHSYYVILHVRSTEYCTNHKSNDHAYDLLLRLLLLMIDKSSSISSRPLRIYFFFVVGSFHFILLFHTRTISQAHIHSREEEASRRSILVPPPIAASLSCANISGSSPLDSNETRPWEGPCSRRDVQYRRRSTSPCRPCPCPAP